MAVREARQNVRSRLQLVDSLQRDGQVDEAVEELLHVAAIYTTRNVPIKAVAVLRQAARLRPERADVRMIYGEVFHKLRMEEDAARELRQACDLYHAHGEYGHELEALIHLVALDEGNLRAQLEVAEALGRAGRRVQAAAVYRRLAASLLEAGLTEDWELVAERVIFFDPSDVTGAHDLALHYVRSGRYAEALSKLIICYASEPGDLELLELIIETLEFLGQRNRAAALTRQIVTRFRRSGLQAEADAALQRLYALDPDDEEAKRAVGVLASVVENDTVIELQGGDGLKVGRQLADREGSDAGFVQDFVDELIEGAQDSGAQPKVKARRPVSRDGESQALRRLKARTGLPTASSVKPKKPSRRSGAVPHSSTSSSKVVKATKAAPRVSPRVEAPSRAFAPDEEKTPPPRSALAEARQRRATGRAQVSAAGKAPAGPSALRRPSRPNRRGIETNPQRPSARRSGAYHPMDVEQEASVDGLEESTLPLIPVPRRRAPQQRPFKGTAQSTRRSKSVIAQQASIGRERDRGGSVSEDDEAGFDGQEDRTMIDPGLLERLSKETFQSAASSRSPLKGADTQKNQKARSSGVQASVRAPQALSVGRRGTGPREVSAEIDDLDPPTGPVRHLNPRRRSGNLPRPRLTRSGAIKPERLVVRRGIASELKTLDFFIERGFVESAVALLTELDKRHPDHEELRLRKQRIASMSR